MEGLTPGAPDSTIWLLLVGGPECELKWWWEAAVVEVLERMPREHLHNFMSWTWAGFLPVTFCFAPLLLSQSTALSSAPSTWY